MANFAVRLAGATGWPGLGVSVAAGVLVAFGQAPFHLWPLAIVGLLLAFLRGLGGGFWRGFLFGFGFAALAMAWIVDPFLVDAARFGWLGPLALVTMAAGFGIFWGIAFLLARLIAPAPGPARLVAVAACLTLMELTRSYVFTGLPWALVSFLWLGTPVYQVASLTGPHGLTLLTLLAVAALVRALLRGSGKNAAFAVLPFAILWIFGLWLTPVPAVVQGPETVLRLVQPNAPQKLKWDPAWRDVFFQRLLDLTASPGDADIVIWPEVAVTFRLDDPDAPYATISAAAAGRPVILGGQRVEADRGYNSLIVLGTDARPLELYDKHHLVPFGEYMPGGPIARKLGLRGLAEQLAYGFSEGPGPEILSTDTRHSFLPLICYEVIFPQEIRRVGMRPDFLLNVTNDAWFGHFSGPYQHLDQARARAVEFHLPVIRVANTGISAAIGIDGSLLATLPLDKSGYLDVNLPAPGEATPYWRFGDIPAFIAAIVLAFVLAGRRRRKSD